MSEVFQSEIAYSKFLQNRFNNSKYSDIILEFEGIFKFNYY
jgi:hypothetical protein